MQTQIKQNIHEKLEETTFACSFIKIKNKKYILIYKETLKGTYKWHRNH